MKRKCSARYRSEILRDMSREGLDLLIVGGGLTAASIAWEASGQGLRIGLIEEHDFASWSDGVAGGTVPDLEWESWRRKAERNAECEHYRQMAPHAIQQQRFVLPYYKKNRVSHLRTKLKLKGFEWMSRRKGPMDARLLNTEQMLDRYPLMLQRRLKGGLEYDDYVYDLGRLTIEMIKGAYERGALTCNYAGVSSWIEQDGSISGAVVEDQLTKKSYTVQAKSVILAAGPLNGRYTKLAPLHKESYTPHEMNSKFHIVIENKHFQLEQALYIPTLEGGHLEVIPFKGMIHAAAEVPSSRLHVEWDIDKQIHWMLSGIKEVFPGVELVSGDVQWYWESHVPSSALNKLQANSYDVIVAEEAHLTELRQLSLDTVQAVQHYLKEVHHFRPLNQPTSGSKLPGGGFIGKDFEAYRDLTIESFVQRGIPQRWAGHLLDAYGSNSEYIIRYFNEISEKESTLMRLLCAEILYAVDFEMAASVADVLIRRPGLGSIHYSYVDEIMDAVVRICAQLLEWDEAEQYRQQEWLKLELSHHGVRLHEERQQEHNEHAEQAHTSPEQNLEQTESPAEANEEAGIDGEQLDREGAEDDGSLNDCDAPTTSTPSTEPAKSNEQEVWERLREAMQEAAAGGNPHPEDTDQVSSEERDLKAANKGERTDG